MITYTATSLHVSKRRLKHIGFNQLERTLKYFAKDAKPIFNIEQFWWVGGGSPPLLKSRGDQAPAAPPPPVATPLMGMPGLTSGLKKLMRALRWPCNIIKDPLDPYQTLTLFLEGSKMFGLWQGRAKKQILKTTLLSDKRQMAWERPQWDPKILQGHFQVNNEVTSGHQMSNFEEIAISAILDQQSSCPGDASTKSYKRKRLHKKLPGNEGGINVLAWHDIWASLWIKKNK